MNFAARMPDTKEPIVSVRGRGDGEIEFKFFYRGIGEIRSKTLENAR